MPYDLTIPQSLFLLARDEQTGRSLGNYSNYIQAGGALSELITRGHLAVDPHRRARITPINAAPTGSVYLDAVLERVASARRSKSIKSWVTNISSMGDRIEMIGGELATSGITQRKPARILGLFPTTHWPLRDHHAKDKLLADMAGLMFNSPAKYDAHTATIVAFANQGHLLKRNFDRTELRQHKRSVKDITKGDWPGVSAAAKAVQAAVISSVAAATVVTTGGP